MSNSNKLAYTAGIVDGEGCIGLYVSNGKKVELWWLCLHNGKPIPYTTLKKLEETVAMDSNGEEGTTIPRGNHSLLGYQEATGRNSD